MTLTERLEPDRIVFPKLGIDISVDETAFSLFGFEIKWYGLIIAFGMLLAMIYGFSQMKKYGIDTDRAMDVVIGGIIGGLIGARAYYVIMKWEDYSSDWKSIFNFRTGGLAIYGGIIGAIAVGGLVAKLRKVKFLPLLDVCSIGFLLGLGIGRWGNFTNQEAFGYNTSDSIFGMSGGKIQEWIINASSNTANPEDITSMSWNIPVHPCFLYESAWCILGFILFALFAKKIRRFDGQVFLMYAGWYGLGRFFIEGLRTDSLIIGTLRVSQVLAAVCVITSVILLIIFSLKVKRMGDEYVLYCNTKESINLINKKYNNITEQSETKFTDSDKDSEINESEENMEYIDNSEDEIENEISEDFNKNEGEN